MSRSGTHVATEQHGDTKRRTAWGCFSHASVAGGRYITAAAASEYDLPAKRASAFPVSGDGISSANASPVTNLTGAGVAIPAKTSAADLMGAGVPLFGTFLAGETSPPLPCAEERPEPEPPDSCFCTLIACAFFLCSFASREMRARHAASASASKVVHSRSTLMKMPPAVRVFVVPLSSYLERGGVGAARQSIAPPNCAENCAQRIARRRMARGARHAAVALHALDVLEEAEGGDGAELVDDGLDVPPVLLLEPLEHEVAHRLLRLALPEREVPLAPRRVGGGALLAGDEDGGVGRRALAQVGAALRVEEVRG